jgi:hypothetical protein
MSKYGEIHLHCLDQFDSQNDPKRVVKRLAEMGAKGFCSYPARCFIGSRTDETGSRGSGT